MPLLSCGGAGGGTPAEPALTGIIVSPASSSIPKGTTQQFTATGQFSDGTTEDLTTRVAWSSSNSSVVSISSSGVATGQAVGSASIAAASQKFTAAASLSVTPASLVSVSISPATGTIEKGQTLQFTATGKYSDGSTQNISGTVGWASSDSGVATISSTGLATGVSQGTAGISCTSGSIESEASITVGPAGLVSISVTPTAATISKGLTQQFTVTANFSDGTMQNVTSSAAWSSSNQAVATVTDGLATGVSPGNATISAAYSGLQSTAALTVGQAALVSIAVSPGTVSIAKGLTQQFTATGTYSDKSTQDLTTQVTWSSSNNSVATISSGGLATGVGQGTATISATLSGIVGNAVLTVTPPVLISITVKPAAASVPLGLTQQFTATGMYTDNSTQDLTNTVQWNSSDTAVATIASGGLATSVGQGNSSIFAMLNDVTGTALMSVTPPALVSISVSPSSATIAEGQTQQFTATGNYTDNSTQNLTGLAAWSSSNTSVATVATGGLATGVGQGTATITAAYASFTGNAMLTVGPPQLVSISVTPPSVTINIGATQQFTATGTYTDNSQQDLTSQVTWSSSDKTIATINASGLATGVAQGTVTITAALGTVSGTASLTVEALQLDSITVSPANATVPLGSTQQFTATGTFSDGSQQDITSSVTWSTSDTNIAIIGNSPDSPGLATGEGIGNCTVQASSGSVNGTAALTVSEGGNVSVTLTPQQTSLTFSQTQQYTATVQGTTNSNVAWSVDGIAGGNSGIGTITTDGLYSPPGVGGMHSITATSQADPSKSATATVWVSDYAGMFTYRNDLQGTGQNLDEPALSSANVNQNTFGKLFSCPVDGYTYTQPLYIPNLSIAGGVHNVVIVGTENDSVYAFDADSSSCQILWHTTFLSAGVTPIPSTDVGNGHCNEVIPQIGITATPVVDLANNSLFVVAATLEGDPMQSASYIYRLHSLNLTTGQEEPGSPVQISASVPGMGSGSNNGMVSFDGRQQSQRTGLRLVNGVLYFGAASHCDSSPWHGWIFAYNELPLSQAGVYCTTANGDGGGVWMTQAGLSFDSDDNIFFVTGNGTFDANLAGIDYGDSVLKMGFSGGVFQVLDSFTPYNQAMLDSQNLDLGTFGLLLLPDQPGPYPHLAVGASKAGALYLLNRDNLGGYNSAGDTQIVQELNGVLHGNFSTATYWNENVYIGGIKDVMKVFQLSNGLLSTTWTSATTAEFGYPGIIASISAASPTASTAILWVLDNGAYGALGSIPGPAILHAYDATNLATELYNSTQAPNNRDQADNAVKFGVPTVANGKVYFGTQSALDVYGLLPGAPPQKPQTARPK